MKRYPLPLVDFFLMEPTYVAYHFHLGNYGDLLDGVNNHDYVDRAAYGRLKYRIGEWLGLRGSRRPHCRSSTIDSPKWENGKHNAGCVLHAPDSVCICAEFRAELSTS